MAKVDFQSFNPAYDTGKTARFLVRRQSDGKIWNQLTGAFEAYTSANWTAAKYMIAMSEGSPGYWSGTFPAGVPADTSLNIDARYDTVVGTPSPTDPVAAQATLSWDGTQILTPTSGGGFTGPSAVTLTFHDSAAAIVAGATFTIVGVGSATADGSGVATFNLANGTYTVRTGPTLGVLFDDAELVVSGATALTITGTTVQASLPALPGVGLATGYLDCLDTLGAPAPGAQIEVQRTATAGSAGQSALRESIFADAADNGRVTVILQASTAFRARRDNGPWVAFTSTGSGTTFALPYLLGQAGGP